jgi:hypothetical protein
MSNIEIEVYFHNLDKEFQKYIVEKSSYSSITELIKANDWDTIPFEILSIKKKIITREEETHRYYQKEIK